MELNWQDLVIPAMSFCAGFISALMMGLKDKVTEIFFSRSGFQVYTNSSDVSFEIMGELERIDSSAQKTIRKGSTGMELLPVDQHGTSTEVILVNYKAVMPLVIATYENHHTRELLCDGADGYIAEKTNELLQVTQHWKKRFPNLTKDYIADHVCTWTKTALVPALRKACNEKINFYKSLLARTNISESVKVKIKEWLAKNERYIVCIDELNARSGIQYRTSIIMKGENDGNG